MPKLGVILMAFILFLVGCNKNEQNGDEAKMQSLVGYVVLKDDDSAILITSTEAPVKEDYKLSEEQLINKFKNQVVIIGLSELDNKDDLKQGKKIKVWFNILKESDPPRTTIQKYEIL
ncbi:DUF3221 domain-containing protein [Bacillus atrophaeus]|uniref:DUF3221 domain-containing protein n=1 Tax=Bacillus atrophaeus TaxID=1452 RepID=UPI00227DE706|nr:DUF3221 domain-containing protein [Bacillus atrophaeus]MCY8513754.1 YobA family protein [Bacillus atrophaeus]MCY8993442.1 YobA family protein [Bacillus atrophaeus]